MVSTLFVQRTQCGKSRPTCPQPAHDPRIHLNCVAELFTRVHSRGTDISIPLTRDQVDRTVNTTEIQGLSPIRHPPPAPAQGSRTGTSTELPGNTVNGKTEGDGGRPTVQGPWATCDDLVTVHTGQGQNTCCPYLNYLLIYRKCVRAAGEGRAFNLMILTLALRHTQARPVSF